MGLVIALSLRGRAGGSTLRPGHWLRATGAHVSGLFRHPARLLTATAASGGTTVVLALGFSGTVRVVDTSAPALPLGSLVVIYLIGSALGSAASLPAVLGVTETALVAGLTLSGCPWSSAVVAVAVFRGCTFWLPTPLGVLAGWHLRRRRLL